MSRPTIIRLNSNINDQNEEQGNVRACSLRPMINFIRNESSTFNKLLNAVNIDKSKYQPSTDIKPILATDREQINTCISIMSEYLNCRDINPEYKCEEIREFLLKIKCI